MLSQANLKNERGIRETNSKFSGKSKIVKFPKCKIHCKKLILKNLDIDREVLLFSENCRLTAPPFITGNFRKGKTHLRSK